MNNMPISSPISLLLTIKIIQLNCNKKGSTIHSLLNIYFNNTDLFLLQKPQQAQISPNSTKGLVDHRAWTPILPTTTQSTNDPPLHIIAYFQSCPSIKVVLYSNYIQDQDIQILNIIYQGSPTTTIINLYNDHKQYNKYATTLLHTISLSHNQLIIITGDWNIYYYLQSSSPNVNSSMKTDYMVDQLMSHSYLLSIITG